jgi:hypothetical protein
VSEQASHIPPTSPPFEDPILRAVLRKISPMEMKIVFGCLTVLATTFLGGCTVYDANGRPSTVVPIMGTDEYGNPTMTWVSASGLLAGAPYSGPVVASDGYDYSVDPIVYPDDFDPGYLEVHGFYFHNGHYHRWHGGGPRYWAAHHGVVRNRNGQIIRRGNVARRLPTRTTVAVRKK